MNVAFGKILKVVVALFAVGLLTACSDNKVSSEGKMSGADLAKIQADNKEKEKYLVIDVRSADEYKAGHLKHAINIPFDQVANRLSELDGYQNKDIVVYCNTGNKSGKVEKQLKEKGFTKVINAEGVKQYNYDLYKFGSINANQFNQISSNPNLLVIDVRAKKDYDEGHIQGAINIPDGEPLENYKAILEANKDKKIVAHCYTGNRSAKLVETLTAQGYDASNLLDGTKEYKYNLVK
ncbi:MULTISPECIES: rhodanese-like domain-containing protein [unclassified Campylobacter]|uniref:rhodanese-like domain-containing protein n=1 Tax=unclassified Campylobacter TaxID=2593542 RepID=UPI001451AC9F|nr:MULTISPECIES: rhodanese-like domain-containing protein [unclassified Campylobacter]QCD53147.1 putative rhodanese-related sulfurtransferase (tandem rhodanese domains) [Campylobacter sp. RM16192]